MIRTLKDIFALGIAENVNAFLYYFKRIPLLGRLLSDKIYGDESLKKAITILVMLFRAAWGFLGKMIYIGLTMYLPISLLYRDQKDGRLTAFVHLLFFFNFLLVWMMNSNILEPKRQKFVCVSIMKMNAKRYSLFTVFSKILLSLIYFLPAVLLVTTLMGGTLWQGCLLTILTTEVRLIAEATHVFLYQRTRVNLMQKVWYVVIVGGGTLALAYLLLFLRRPLPFVNILFQWYSPLVVTALALFAVLYLIRFQNYEWIVRTTNKQELFTAAYKTEVKKASFSDVDISEKKLDASAFDTKKYQQKQGYEYFNAIFFERHKRLLEKPIIIRLAGILLLFAAALVGVLAFPEIAAEYNQFVLRSPNILVFIMYLLSTCPRMTKAMFYNCDISMLRYPYYRERSVVLKNFKIRLSKIARLNFYPALAISAGMLLLAVVSRADGKMLLTMFPVFVSVLVLSLLFSVHHLFMYYVFQPYTADLEMKNPFFNVVNGIMYMLCFLCLQLDSAPRNFAIILIVLTLAYIGAALFLIYKFADRTFRIR